MCWNRLILILVPALAGCAANPDKRTLAELRHMQADVEEVQVEDSLDKAMQGYRRFLDETPTGARTPEAMRRLADLKIEKEYGIIGDGRPVELPAPPQPGQMSVVSLDVSQALHARAAASGNTTGFAESEQDFEQRATESYALAEPEQPFDLQFPGSPSDLTRAGPLEAIQIYKQLLLNYPSYERNDQVLYQMARAYDELGRTDDEMRVTERLIAEYPYSKYIDEVQFRRAEYFFARKRYREAENAYSAIITIGAGSSYYELALYKLGWTLYKQEFYEEALHKYIALLDHKVSVGYDFDEAHDEDEERRTADTFRVISLAFSNLGGSEIVNEYFSRYGNRGYEYRIYRNLGEFYLHKLRYQDAASTYEAFVELNPFHRISPHFSMRVIEIYAEGGFPRLVVDSKKEFSTKYGMQAEYWHYFDVEESPEVLSYLKTNLTDLANHYHALYQDESLADEQYANYGEALRWYREFLASFPEDPESPSINYQLADILLEHQDYREAATEYERTAYDYPVHERASAAGYAAIYAYREHLKTTGDALQLEVKRATVASSLRFADTFPDHEHAASVLGAAADDLYQMNDFQAAIASARKLIDRYPDADLSLRRSAWVVVAHSSFDLAEYPDAEHAYGRVLELTPENDDSRPALFDNLAATIYKQGEQANSLEDYRAAADHFLRISRVAPTSQIRPAAEYDAAAALMRLEDWSSAAEVLEAFRDAYPEHELQSAATKELAFVYREDGRLSRSAAEYERVADESDDLEVRREALLLAGELYEQAKVTDSALDVYIRYVAEFPEPIDIALETRFKVAEMYKAKEDPSRYYEELQQIVDIDKAAGTGRTDRTRYLAAQSALVLSVRLYRQFADVMLTQPFERSLAEKKRRMDAAMASFAALVDYEVAEVTAAATFYMAEVYHDFSRSLLESERPADLDAAERTDYELAIEEEAFPFEERAIDVHEENLELMVAGVYNRWIQQSLDRLAQLMPGRYAKNEISSGYVGSIDTYAYRSPNAPEPEASESENDLPAAGEPTASLDSGTRERVDNRPGTLAAVSE